MKKTDHRFYEFLTENDEPRACSTIPDEDCSHVPENFTLNVANGSLTKLAEKIISPDLTLAWIFNYLGASSALIGALVPIKDLGSLLPQLAISGKIRSKPIRKWFWVYAGLIQAICLGLSGVFILQFNTPALPYILAFLLLVFSMASGMGSVAFKDVTGKTVPKGERGQMLSYRSTFGGALALIAGGILTFFIKDQEDPHLYSGMFFLAASLWLGASWLFAKIKELPGSTQGGRTPLKEFLGGMKLLKEDKNFQKFLMTRALLMAIPLLQPFYVLLAKDLEDLPHSFLGYLIIISAIAQVIGSPLWGKFADKNPKFLMRISSFIALFGLFYALSFTLTNPLFSSVYAFIPVFFINGIAYAGARLSRKTYLVDYAPEADRPTYVSLANTSIGLFTILAGSFGLVSKVFGLGGQLMFFGILLIACIILSFKLEETG